MFAKKTNKKSLEELFETYISSEAYQSWQEKIINNLVKGLGNKVNISSQEALETQIANKKELLEKKKKAKEDKLLFIALLSNKQTSTVKLSIDGLFIKIKNDAIKWMETQSALKRMSFKLFGKSRTEALEKHLKSKNIKYASTIARTNTSRLNTDTIETTSMNLGVIAYLWDATLDGRTRPGHRLMNNVIVFWDEKPTPGKYNRRYPNTRSVHAGQDYQCRCVPKPIFDWKYFFATRSNYRVWLNGSIQVMSTRRLKELVSRKLGVIL